MTQQQIQQTLVDFGLTDNEVKIYLASLAVEETSPYQLAKKTGIARTTVYDTLTNLALKGLVTLQQSDGFSKQQTKVRAKNPSFLREIIKQKKQSLSLLELQIVDILPALKENFHGNQANADFQFFPGIAGAKQVYFEKHLPDLEVCAFENLMPMDAFGRTEINQELEKEAKQVQAQQIRLKELVAWNDWTRHVLTYQVNRSANYLKSREIRVIENPVLKIKQRITMQGDHLSIVSGEEDEMWALKIRSRLLVTTFKSIFQLLWLQAKPVTPQLIKSLGKNDFLAAEQRLRRLKKTH